ncbi:MAG: hypothetical protein JRH19_26555 [Deltaproteobacteria bacterium]|nr:hypothetical protein [Deltaproteobacteria bacterium]
MARQSDRAFGLTLGVVLLVIALVYWLIFDGLLRWCLQLAPVVLAIALVKPGLLLPVNRFFAGVVAPLFAAINNRIILGGIFYLLLTPTGVLMRLFGRDTMERGFDESAESYFVPVERQAEPENFREIF